MFTEGSASLPSRGIGEVTQQLAETLPLGSLHLNTRIDKVDASGKRLSGSIFNGQSKQVESIEFICDKTVVATDPTAFVSILRRTFPSSPLTSNSSYTNNSNSPSYSGDSFNKSVAPSHNSSSAISSWDRLTESTDREPLAVDLTIPVGRGSICLYYGIDGAPPILAPVLILNGQNSLPNSSEGSYPPVINNVCFPSQVSSEYAPAGKSLASVTVVGDVDVSDAELEMEVRAQLMDWFGALSIVDKWKHLKTYRIKYAQPASTPTSAEDGEGVLRIASASRPRATKISENIHCCGDHRDTATLNGAISSGKRAALGVVADLASAS